MKTSRAAILVCSVLLFSAEILVGQSAPGVFADANHPGGPPDPQKLDAVWQVDPISDQVTINIPFTTTPQGGRGPKLPFALLYNSGSTVTLQGAGTYPIPGGVAVSDFLWSTKPISGSSTAPSGPWTTTGPFLYYTVADYPTLSAPYPPYTVYGYGCTIDGPYVYVDENGSAHDMNLDNLIGVSPGETPLAPACYAAYGQWRRPTVPRWPPRLV